MKSKPDFVIAGSVKCGTTWLFDMLKHNDCVFSIDPKEPHYYSQCKTRRNKSYMGHVLEVDDYSELFSECSSNQLACDASASYFWSPLAFEKLRKENPECKVIVLLRDPIDRAYSHYLMDVREGTQKRDFYSALLDDEVPSDESDRKWDTCNLYVDLGLYEKHLKNLYEHIPAENVLVLKYSDIISRPLELLIDVETFLGIKSHGSYPVGKKSNEFSLPANKLSSAILGSEKLRHISKNILPLELRKRVKSMLLDKNSKKPDMTEKEIEYLKSRLYLKDEYLKDKLGEDFFKTLRRW